jgi:hypothetical protein
VVEESVWISCWVLFCGRIFKLFFLLSSCSTSACYKLSVLLFFPGLGLGVLITVWDGLTCEDFTLIASSSS